MENMYEVLKKVVKKMREDAHTQTVLTNTPYGTFVVYLR